MEIDSVELAENYGMAEVAEQILVVDDQSSDGQAVAVDTQTGENKQGIVEQADTKQTSSNVKQAVVEAKAEENTTVSIQKTESTVVSMDKTVEQKTDNAAAEKAAAEKVAAEQAAAEQAAREQAAREQAEREAAEAAVAAQTAVTLPADDGKVTGSASSSFTFPGEQQEETVHWHCNCGFRTDSYDDLMAHQREVTFNPDGQYHNYGSY